MMWRTRALTSLFLDKLTLLSKFLSYAIVIVSWNNFLPKWGGDFVMTITKLVLS
jgi:hypothetical protein